MASTEARTSRTVLNDGEGERKNEAHLAVELRDRKLQDEKEEEVSYVLDEKNKERKGESETNPNRFVAGDVESVSSRSSSDVESSSISSGSAGSSEGGEGSGVGGSGEGEGSASEEEDNVRVENESASISSFFSCCKKYQWRGGYSHAI